MQIFNKIYDKRNSISLKNKIGIISVLASWLWLIAGFILDIWYQLVPGEWIIDSDLAAEMVLADMLNKEGSIISTNWFYSTEIKVFNLQWFYRIGLLIFPDNWTYARTFSMALVLLVVIAAWMFFMHACGAGKFAVWAAAFAIWPFSFRYHFLAVYGGYYYVYHVFSLVTFGIILLLSNRKYSASKRILLILAGAILSLASGLNGARQLMSFFAPICVAVIVTLYVDMRKESIKRWGDLFAKKSVKIYCLVYSYLFALFNGIGYLINSRILYKRFTFDTQTDIYWQVNHDTEIPDVFLDFTQLFGFRTDVKVFSAEGIASALGLAMSFFVIYSIIRLCRNYSLFSQCEQLVLTASLSAIAVMGITFCYMDHKYIDKYWLSIIPFGMILICMELKTDTFELPGLKRALIVIVSICITVCSLSTVKLAIRKPLYGQKGLYEVAMWLEENNYSKGIAEFWKSQCITEMTNGKIEMWSLRKEENSTFYHWLQDTSHINPPEGKVFLILGGTSDETKENPNVLAGNGVLVYDDERYSVYEFDDVSWMGENQ